LIRALRLTSREKTRPTCRARSAWRCPLAGSDRFLQVHRAHDVEFTQEAQNDPVRPGVFKIGAERVARSVALRCD
jgi:hypothetical protein